MKRAIIFLIALAIGVAACAQKDPTGYLTRMEGALQDYNYPQALVYAAMHSTGTVKSKAMRLTKELGKIRACREITAAKKMAREESDLYLKDGNLNKHKEAKEAFARLNQVEFDFCN